MFREDLNFEQRLLRLARTRGHSAAAERAVARFSRAGEHGRIWLALGALGGAAQADRRPQWRNARRTVLAVYATNTAIKLLVRRDRPSLPGLPPLASTASALSFPSAHTSTSFAGALAYRRLGLPAAPLYALATTLGLSRLYLGVHYPSDVLAGALLGTAMGAALTSREALS